MKSIEALRALAEITASQWGLVTSAQAAEYGISRLRISRLAEAGLFIRIAQGVYMDAGTPSTQFDELRAAWLSTDPQILAEERLHQDQRTVVVAGSSAAFLHEIGDLWSTRHEFVSSVRRQSQRSEIRYRRRTVEPEDITLVAGLPTMTIERTVVDLVEDLVDLSLVADVLRDASLKRQLDLIRLEALLAPLAARNGFKKYDGAMFLQRLMVIAGIDEKSVAQGIASNPSLSERVVSKYISNKSEQAVTERLKTRQNEDAIADFHEDLANILREVISVQIQSMEAGSNSASLRIIEKLDVPRMAATVSKRLLESEVVQRISNFQLRTPSAADGEGTDD